MSRDCSVGKKKKLGWLLAYGFRPWRAWLSSSPIELKPDEFLSTLGHDPTKVPIFENDLKDLVIDVASKVTSYVRDMGRSPGAIDRDQAVLLYLLVRIRRPKVVVETGVAQGVSTAFLLKGLHDNGEGRLYSIDLPFFEGSSQPNLPYNEIYPIPKGMRPGWMVPDEIKDRWELLQGDCRDLLAPLLDRLGPVELFLQDDLHAYKHMLWEFRTAWPHLGKGGLLLSHDWEKNPALCQFARENSLPLIKCCRMGCVLKGPLNQWKEAAL